MHLPRVPIGSSVEEYLGPGVTRESDALVYKQELMGLVFNVRQRIDGNKAGAATFLHSQEVGAQASYPEQIPGASSVLEKCSEVKVANLVNEFATAWKITPIQTVPVSADTTHTLKHVGERLCDDEPHFYQCRKSQKELSTGASLRFSDKSAAQLQALRTIWMFSQTPKVGTRYVEHGVRCDIKLELGAS